MSKAEQFIKDCTRSCSNLEVSLDSDIVCSYAPWITPEQALRAVEIAKEEMIDTIEVKEINSTDAFIEKACEFFGEHLWEYINVKNANCDTFINIDGDKLIEDFKKYMKGE